MSLTLCAIRSHCVIAYKTLHFTVVSFLYVCCERQHIYGKIACGMKEEFILKCGVLSCALTPRLISLNGSKSCLHVQNSKWFGKWV